jgi:uncharacterized Zn finger protein
MRRRSRDEVLALTALAERALQLEAGYPSFTRGARYAEADLVSAMRFSNGVLTARVKGTRRYRVAVDLREQPTFACNCPIGAEGAVCKHAVATVLAWLGRPT